MQSWFFPDTVVRIDQPLQAKKLFGVSVLPSGHRVAEEHKEHSTLRGGSPEAARRGFSLWTNCSTAEEKDLQMTETQTHKYGSEQQCNVKK